jgi:hypothetical protein
MSLILYSKSTNGFYDPEINTIIPEDVIEIAAEVHSALISGQATGKIISPNEMGFPVLVDAPVATNEQLIAAIDTKVAALLAATDWVIDRADEFPSGNTTNYVEYRNALHNISTQPGYPSEVVWPVLG